MPVPNIPPPTEVLRVVFVAWAAGTVVFAAVSRTWGEIQAGHFKVMWLVSAGLALAAGFGYPPAWALAAICLLAFAAIYRGRDREVGLVGALASLAVLGLGAPLYAVGTAALMGSVTNAMLLGHWHLNQPKLTTKPIFRLVVLLWAGIAAFIVSTAALLLSGVNGVGSLAAATALSFAVFAGVLTAMVHHLVRTRSIMSATGILYLEILLVLVAAFTGSLASLARA